VAPKGAGSSPGGHPSVSSRATCAACYLKRAILRQSSWRSYRRRSYRRLSSASGIRPSSLRSKPAFTECPRCFNHHAVSCTRLRSRYRAYARCW
jgi:hypothetical protein